MASHFNEILLEFKKIEQNDRDVVLIRRLRKDFYNKGGLLSN